MSRRKRLIRAQRQRRKRLILLRRPETSSSRLIGQSDALRLGIARAIVDIAPDLRVPVKKQGLLTRDARRVERKKYGLRKARRAPQFTKR